MLKASQPNYLSRFFLACFVFLFLSIEINAAIWYVTPTQVGTGTGNSWANGTNDIQKVINSATSTDQIWVAAGVYVPMRRANNVTVVTLNDRFNSFVLKDGVGVYGGFVGNETFLSQRNFTANISVLSGDFSNNDVVTGSGASLNITGNIENAHHVLVSVSDGSATVLDGFTISGANANAASTATINVETILYQPDEGGGVCIRFSNIQLSNCVIKNNACINYGAGIYLGNSSPIITNCFVNNNLSAGGIGNGGAMFCFQSSNPIIKNSIFTGNRATNAAGGIYILSTSSPSLINTTFNNNSGGNGGAINNGGTTGLLSNVVLWGNPGGSIAGGVLTVEHSVVEGGYAGTGNINADPLFANASDPDGVDNTWGNSDDGLLFNCYSPAVNTGTTTALTPIIDVRGINRPQFGTVDMGPYEDITNLTPTVTILGATTGCNFLSLVATGATSYTWTGGVAPTASLNTFLTGGVFTITGISVPGCTNVTTTTVTINTPAVISLNVSHPVICLNATTSILATGANTYTWTGGITNGASFSPTSTTAYTVTGTDANNCNSTASATITVNPLPVVTASASKPVICMTGTTSLHGGGASTYTWTGGAVNNAVFSPVATQGYTVTGTDVNTCTNTAAITITVAPAPVVTATISHPAVCLNATTSVHGAGASTYTWTGGITNGTPFSPAATLSYTVTGTDVNTCTNTAVVTITVNPLPIVTASASMPAICLNGTTSLHGGGASTYTWTGGVTNATAFSPASTLSYTVTGFDLNACTNTAAITVTVNTLPVVTGSASNPVVCMNATTSLHGSGANTYTWTGGVTNANPFNPTATLSYTVTGADLNACTNTAVVTITTNPLPVVTASASVPVICLNATTSVHGGGATSYTWTGGATNATPFSPASTLIYTVTGAGANACTNTAVVTITVNPLPVVTGSISNPIICTNGTTSVHGTGASTYTWTGGVSNAVSFSLAATTIYTVTGTDVNNCTNTAVATVSVVLLPPVMANATSSAVCVNGTVSLYGTGANSYTWTGGITNALSFTPTATDTYTVTGFIGAGCSNTAVITLSVNPLPTVVANASPTNVICAGQTLTLSGSGASTYTWSSVIIDGAPFNPSITDSYFVTGTDANGCSNTATIQVVVNPLPVLSATITSKEICIGGTVTLTGSGANTYTWTGGVTNGVAFSPAATANYSLMGSSADCISANPVVVSVTVNALPQLTVNSGSVCIGNSFNITPTGAVTYTYVNGGNNVTPLTTTSYSIFGTDDKGCVNDPAAVSTVVVNNLPVVNLTASQTTLCAGYDLKITASGALTYTWNNGENTDEINLTPFLASVYSVTATDINSCVGTASISIDILPSPNVVVSPANLGICLGSPVALTAIGADTYEWNTGETTASITKTITTTTSYTIKGTNANNCSMSKALTVTVNPLPTVDLGPDVEISAGVPYQFNASQTGASTYSWAESDGLSNTTILNPEVTINEERSFTLTVTSSRGCKASDDITVRVIDNLIIANYMSPNGDGKNDTWKVSSTYSIKDCGVEVIDGWGKSVYKKDSGYNNDFDAADLPDGVYYYFITQDNKIKYKGSITVTR